MHNTTHQTPVTVDARLAGGDVMVSLNEDPELFTDYVSVDFPGKLPLLLQAHEAYALAAALDAAANEAEDLEAAR